MVVTSEALEDATMAKDCFHWGEGCWNTVHRAHKMTYTDLNCLLQRMFLTVAFGDEDANSRYDCTVQRTGAVHSWSWNFSRPTLQDRDQDHKYQDQDLASQDQGRIKLVLSALETKTAVSGTTSLVSSTVKSVLMIYCDRRCIRNALYHERINV